MANTKVTSKVIADGTITATQIANDAVTGAKIADDVALAGNPTTTTQSAGNNTTRIATTAFVTTAVDNLIDSAPGALNTLNELAAALGDDASFSTTITNSIATKAALAGAAFTGDISVTDSSGLGIETSGFSLLSSSNNSRAASGSIRLGNGAGSTGLVIDYTDQGQTVATIRNVYVASTSSELTIQSPFITLDTGTSYTQALLLDHDQNATFAGNIIANDVKASGSGGLSLQTDEGTKRIFINDNGNVAIGTASLANAPLHVAADTGNSVSAVMRLRGSNSTARVTRLQFEDYSGAIADGLIDFVIPSAGSATGAYLGLGYNATTQLQLHNGSTQLAGNVGIGGSPTNLLQVFGGNSDSRIQFTNNTSGNAYADGFWVGMDNTQAYLLQRENQPISFFTNATKKHVMNADGAVGLNCVATAGHSFEAQDKSDGYSMLWTGRSSSGEGRGITNAYGLLGFNSTQYDGDGATYPVAGFGAAADNASHESVDFWFGTTTSEWQPMVFMCIGAHTAGGQTGQTAGWALIRATHYNNGVSFNIMDSGGGGTWTTSVQGSYGDDRTDTSRARITYSSSQNRTVLSVWGANYGGFFGASRA